MSKVEISMEQKKYRVLLAEDDRDIVEFLKLYLENAGYQVLTAYDGEAAYKLVQTEEIDIGVFDIMMPRMDGFHLIKKTRETKSFPIIVLSAKQEDADKILGLGMGADDYIGKPFNPLEIVARVSANLRRYYDLNERSPINGTDQSEGNILQVGDLILNKEQISLTKKGTQIPLTSTEYKILLLLMQHPGRVYTKVQIYEYINGEYFENDANTLMVHIYNLREKIEDDPKKPAYLKTIRGLGYKIENVK